MSPEERVRDLLVRAWEATLDTDPDTWHESPWAHIVFLIGQQLDAAEVESIVAARTTA